MLQNCSLSFMIVDGARLVKGDWIVALMCLSLLSNGTFTRALWTLYELVKDMCAFTQVRYRFYMFISTNTNFYGMLICNWYRKLAMEYFYKPTWVGLVVLVWDLGVCSSPGDHIRFPDVNFDRLVHTVFCSVFKWTPRMWTLTSDPSY